MAAGKLLNDCFERKIRLHSLSLSLRSSYVCVCVGGTNGERIEGEIFFFRGWIVCWSVFFFVVVILCGMAFVRWRLACFVCVCVCLWLSVKKCKQRQLIEVDILVVVRGHGRRRARLNGSVDARQMALLLHSPPRIGQRPRRRVHHAVVVALRIVIVARLRFGRRAELLRRHWTVLIQQRSHGRIVLSGDERRFFRRA